MRLWIYFTQKRTYLASSSSSVNYELLRPRRVRLQRRLVPARPPRTAMNLIVYISGLLSGGIWIDLATTGPIKGVSIGAGNI